MKRIILPALAAVALSAVAGSTGTAIAAAPSSPTVTRATTRTAAPSITFEACVRGGGRVAGGTPFYYCVGGMFDGQIIG